MTQHSEDEIIPTMGPVRFWLGLRSHRFIEVQVIGDQLHVTGGDSVQVQPLSDTNLVLTVRQ